MNFVWIKYVKLNAKQLLSSFCLITLTASMIGWSGAVPIRRTVHSRWYAPCGGSQVNPLGNVASIDGGKAGKVSMNDPSFTFHTLSMKLSKLRKQVQTLKNLYVEKRFRDESVAEDLDEMGIHFEGMPYVQDTTISEIFELPILPTVHRAFEYLARISVFISQARIGENLAIGESNSFEADFQQLEDHPEYGLYWIMCALHQIIDKSKSSVSRQVFDSVMHMKIVKVDSNAWRHARDYLVLKDIERILERLSMDFASLGKK